MLLLYECTNTHIFKGLKMIKNTKLKQKGISGPVNQQIKVYVAFQKSFICIFISANCLQRQNVLHTIKQNEIQVNTHWSIKIIKN